jgi:molybdopterin-binding protein
MDSRFRGNDSEPSHGRLAHTIRVVVKGGLSSHRKENVMEISARNQLKGKITKITLGNVMAEVHVQVGTNEVTAAITRGSVERLGLKVGDEVTAIVKATEVMIAK